MSSLASQQMSAATSPGSPTRPSGMREVMYETCSSEIWSRIGVSMTAGATELTRMPVPATSLPIAFVIAITPAFDDE